MKSVKKIGERNTALVVAGVTIWRDEHGRYNLNSLHQASGTDASKSPSQWLRRKSTKALITELQGQDVNLPLEVIHGGDSAGTYAHELLAVSYAGWISPAFQLKVNQAFLDMHSGKALVQQVHDPALQIMLGTLDQVKSLVVELDATRQLAEQAQIESAQAKDMALQTLQAVSWLAVSQYVYLHNLHHQCPPPVANAFGRYLTDYCLERNIPMGKWQPYGKQWGQENTYPVSVIQQTLPGWLTRRDERPMIEEEAAVYHIGKRR